MVNPVQQEMERQEHGLVGEVVVDVEQEAVERVLEDGPYDVADEEARAGLDVGVGREGEEGGERQVWIRCE